VSKSNIQVHIVFDAEPYLRALRKLIAPLLWEGDQA
jgi:hypothetical protein